MPESTFTGFGDGLVGFYEGLAVDNSRTYWQAHKNVYDTQVRGPLEALAAVLEVDFGPAKVFRPNRDVRFSADKRPYAEQASMAVQGPAGSALYLALDRDCLLLGAGIYAPSADQLERFRRAVGTGPAAVELDQVLASATSTGLHLADGDPVKTAPRGWPRDHPRIDLLRRRRLTLTVEHEPAPWWHTPHALTVVRDAWVAATPFLHWCDRHVGPPNTTSSSRAAAAVPRRTPFDPPRAP